VTPASNIYAFRIRTIQVPSYSPGTHKSKEIKKDTVVECHALYPQRYPKKHEEKARAIVLFVVFQEETKPYGMKNYILLS